MNITHNNTTEKNLSEALLGAWLHISTSINNSRIVKTLSYNESLICNYLYRNQLEKDAEQMTATKLCERTKILKSQMNRTLNQLEVKGMIQRERSAKDKRVIYIRLNSEAIKDYEQQHETIMEILKRIIAELGLQRTKETIATLEKVCDIADNLFEKGDKKK